MLEIISGTTFENGCGVTIKDTETNEYFVKVVYKDTIEHNGELYYKEDFSLWEKAEWLKKHKTIISCRKAVQNMKLVKNGFGKRKFQVFKPNDKTWIINLFGLAILIGK